MIVFEKKELGKSKHRLTKRGVSSKDIKDIKDIVYSAVKVQSE